MLKPLIPIYVFLCNVLHACIPIDIFIRKAMTWKSHGNKRSSLLLHSVTVTASISVEGVAYCAIDIVVCIKARYQYKGMAEAFNTDEVLNLLGNDDPETCLEPMYPGSDDDLGFNDEETE